MDNGILLAIIGDIVDSKSISNRNETQIKLNKVLKKLNKDYEKYIVSKK